MCELFGMSSRQPTEVTVSLEELARHSLGLDPNRDGWGIAYFEDGATRLVKEAGSAGESPCLRFVENDHLSSQIVIAHIRRASRGTKALRNTHPFERELGGRMQVFAHNGDLPGLADDERFELGRFRPIGETDSEYAFCVLMERLAAIWAEDEPPPVETRLAVVARFAAELTSLGQANFLFSDGRTLFAHSDHRRSRPGEHTKDPGLHVCYRGHIVAVDPLEAEGVRIAGADEQRMTLVASVPLSPEPWQPLPHGTILALEDGRTVGSLPPRG